MLLSKAKSIEFLQLSKLKLKCLAIQQPIIKEDTEKMLVTTSDMIRGIRNKDFSLDMQTISNLLELFSIDVKQQYKALMK